MSADTGTPRSGLARGAGLLAISMLAIAVFAAMPVTAAKKALTAKKGDKRYVNEGQAAVSLGTVTATDYRYGGPVAGSLVVAGAAFAAGYLSSGSVEHSTTTASTTVANDEFAWAPVSLPNGAVVTRLDALVENPSNGGEVTLVSRDADLSADVMAEVTANCSVGTVCSLSDTTIVEATVDNGTRHYDLQIYADSGETLKLYRAVIHYTTTSVGPASG